MRFRKNVKELPGCPDVVFSKERVAVFCDGDFWHGRDWEQRREMLLRGQNATYWVAKIARNRERDELHNLTFASLGWRVLRFWGSDINQDPPGIAAVVRREVLNRRRGNLGG